MRASQPHSARRLPSRQLKDNAHRELMQALQDFSTSTARLLRVLDPDNTIVDTPPPPSPRKLMH